MTETYKKIIESVENGELSKMTKSAEVDERLVALGIVYSMNLYNAMQINLSQALDDACAD